jgi:hypothetical protein
VAAFTAAAAAAAAAAVTEPAAVPGPAAGAEKEPKGDGMGAAPAFFILANMAFFADARPTLLWPLRSLRGLVGKHKSTTT